MTMIFGVPLVALASQLVIGLFNGAFYALLSLGLGVIFGLLRVVNFTHGAFYTVGAFAAFLLTSYAGFSFWACLLIAPLIVAALAAVLERTLLRKLYGLDALYGLLLTFGIALLIEGLLQFYFGVAGQPYQVPDILSGTSNLGFMFLPHYRAFAIATSLLLCLLTWLIIEYTSLGAKLRAATENSRLLEVFGVNVPLLLTCTYAFGGALAGFAGVVAAPVFQVSPLMGANLIIVVFAVVIIGGLGSITGAIVSGLMLGTLEALAKVYWPPSANLVPFLIMAVVLFLRPRGLFGKGE
ncbi:branched-chain amino acid ABC transporter permease [Microvirga sp. BT688]|uniref:branched-chain amino acid ABC transporter permease n=1 Tax=Microvirga sp. TaxID=1873136 RepID=UPI0016857296|nr:branched-chain amino acid ABC transporter permease [Microvirga sp.]MBD2745428.1 branched-chain amino acid ABC transporter permease [Microvirga sp.]